MDGGTAVVCGNIVYCMAYSSRIIHGYLLDEDQWKIKLNFPRCCAAITIISGQLTGVGGLPYAGGSSPSKQLNSWKENGWEVVFPPMSTARSFPEVVSIESYIIVVGQNNKHDSSLEVFTIQTNSWSTINILPNMYANIVLCDDRLYIRSGTGIFSISIEFFKQKEGSNTPSELSIQSNWREHEPIGPSHTLSVIANHLVAVEGTQTVETIRGVGEGTINAVDAGGNVEAQSYFPPRSLYLLDNGQWVNLVSVKKQSFYGNMVKSIVAILSENSILVVGGGTHAVLLELYM